MEDNKEPSFVLPTGVQNLIEKIGLAAVMDFVRVGLNADTAIQIVAKGYKLVKIEEFTIKPKIPKRSQLLARYYPSRNARFVGPHRRA